MCCGGAALAITFGLFQYRKGLSVLPETQVRKKERRGGWSEKHEDFAACGTGLGSAFTLGGHVSLGQSLNVCFLISEIRM